MVGGTYYSAVGELPWRVFAASIPYGLLCTAVLMGKHVDKIPWDEPQGIRTLPVLLGERRSRRITQGLMAAFYVTVVACGVGGGVPRPPPPAVRGVPAPPGAGEG